MRGEAFSETVAAAELVGNHSAAICARGYLAIISADKGDWEEAAQSAEGALLYAGRQKLDEHWVTVMAHYAAGEALALVATLSPRGRRSSAGYILRPAAG